MCSGKNCCQKLGGEDFGGVNNLTSFEIDREKLLETAKNVLKNEGAKGRIDFALVGKKEIKELNRTYRGKDHATDVLSFFYNEKDFLGEVVLCPQKIEENAGESGFKKELFRVAVHGILHILGYDHTKSEKEEKAMKKRTESYIEEI